MSVSCPSCKTELPPVPSTLDQSGNCTLPALKYACGKCTASFLTRTSHKGLFQAPTPREDTAMSEQTRRRQVREEHPRLYLEIPPPPTPPVRAAHESDRGVMVIHPDGTRERL